MKQFILFIVSSLSALLVSSQARWQADVSISSMTLANATIIKQPPIISNPKIPSNTSSSTTTAPISPNLKCSITVHNENDDDAYGTTLVVTLPVEVSVVSMSAGGTTHTASSGGQFIAYVTFDLGHMTVGQNNTVEVVFSKSKYTNKVGAFAYSGSPDPNPANNYKDTTF